MSQRCCPAVVAAFSGGPNWMAIRIAQGSDKGSLSWGMGWQGQQSSPPSILMEGPWCGNRYLNPSKQDRSLWTLPITKGLLPLGSNPPLALSLAMPAGGSGSTVAKTETPQARRWQSCSRSRHPFRRNASWMWCSSMASASIPYRPGVAERM
jgi:hypothetical protein